MTLILKASEIIDQQLPLLAGRCQQLKLKGIIPTMAVFLVGDHLPSLIYTRNKKKFCEKFGAKCDIIHLPNDISKSEFLKKLDEVVKNPSIHGCFIQLPLPAHLKELPLHHLIPKEKDVDGLSAENIFNLANGDKGELGLVPCTPKGILKIFEHYNLVVAGKNIVVIGRSMIVGRPLSYLLTNHDATVTLTHSKTKNIKEFTQKADIIISAIGIPHFITTDFISSEQNTVIIDVGINRKDDHICGDVDYDKVMPFVKAITPVPGGVGPMTILSLADNLLTATERSIHK